MLQRASPVRSVFYSMLAITTIIFLGTALNPAQAGLNDGLVAYYPFNGNANDESGNGNNGAVYGAVLTTDWQGNPNKAYDFGTSSNDFYINVPHKSSLQLYKLTISAWMKTPPNYGEFYGISKGPETPYSLATRNGKYWFVVGTSSSAVGVSSTIDADNQWHHITGTYDGQTAILYVDGVKNASLSFPAAALRLETGPLSFGHRASDGLGRFWGSMDEIRIYNRVLSESEVTELYKGSTAAAIKDCNCVGGFIDFVMINDINGNGASENIGLGLDAKGLPLVCVNDTGNGELIKEIPVFAASYYPNSVKISPDADGNGIKEISICATDVGSGSVEIETHDPKTGNFISILGEN